MNFVRYNPETGAIVSTGQMAEDMLERLVEKGDSIVKTGAAFYPPAGFKVDLATLEIVPDVSDAPLAAELKGEIRVELMRTDYTQAADAADHLTKEERAEWRAYRRAIRAAMNAETLEEMLALLPASSPKSIDCFARFRR